MIRKGILTYFCKLEVDQLFIRDFNAFYSELNAILLLVVARIY
jgi:hypothetical protein